jgi:DnaJ domain
MDASKDYYAVLGVLPSIEPAAIKAVYLALLKKYHPDVYRGTKEEADRRTKEFNEAYEVLGDEKKREDYDRLRAKSTNQSGDYRNESSNEGDDSSDAETLSKWKYVVDYYPEIQHLYTSLAKISRALAFSYRITVLERKLFGTGAATKLAETMKNEYMNRYFGNNESIKEFVMNLITSGRRDAALEINNAIRILGVPAPDMTSSFLEKVMKKYDINPYGYPNTYRQPHTPAHQHEAKAAEQHAAEQHNADAKQHDQPKADRRGFIVASIIGVIISFLWVVISLFILTTAKVIHNPLLDLPKLSSPRLAGTSGASSPSPLPIPAADGGAGNAALPSAGNAALPSAARAAMLIAPPDDPEKPVVNLGEAVWSTIPPTPGQPATIAVQADADIPELKMHATMILRKNTDPTLQATHTIDLKFAFADGAPIAGFKDVGAPQMRKIDSTAAEALTSVKVKISDVYFLIALAKSNQDTARNLDLMQTRAWFDFPLLLNDDRIAKIVFQKSAEGDAMLAKAFEAWK